MPEFILRFKWLGLLFGCVITGITLAGFSLRIRDEEAMMRKKVGDLASKDGEIFAEDFLRWHLQL